jgi:hypothetical protein
VKFFVGAQLTPIWVDQLLLFSGSADVFSREFENGMVLANGSTNPKTIVLNGIYHRINGNLDKQFNNGEKNISQLTLQAYEGIFLVKTGAVTASHPVIKNDQMKVYPNPFFNNLTIEIPEGMNQLEIMNANGELIHRQDTKNLRIVEVNQLGKHPSGVYIARLSGSIQNQIIKIIKQ